MANVIWRTQNRFIFYPIQVEWYPRLLVFRCGIDLLENNTSPCRYFADDALSSSVLFVSGTGYKWVRCMEIPRRRPGLDCSVVIVEPLSVFILVHGHPPAKFRITVYCVWKVLLCWVCRGCCWCFLFFSCGCLIKMKYRQPAVNTQISGLLHVL